MNKRTVIAILDSLSDDIQQVTVVLNQGHVLKGRILKEKDTFCIHTSTSAFMIRPIEVKTIKGADGKEIMGVIKIGKDDVG